MVVSITVRSSIGDHHGGVSGFPVIGVIGPIDTLNDFVSANRVDRQFRCSAHRRFHPPNRIALSNSSDNRDEIASRGIEPSEETRWVSLTAGFVAEVPYHFQADEDSRTNSMFLERTNVPGASAVFRTKQAIPISRLGLFQRECNKLDACLQPCTREQAR